MSSYKKCNLPELPLRMMLLLLSPCVISEDCHNDGDDASWKMSRTVSDSSFFVLVVCWIVMKVCSGDVLLLACSVCSFLLSISIFCVFPSTVVSRKACNLARAIAKFAGSFFVLKLRT